MPLDGSVAAGQATSAQTALSIILEPSWTEALGGAAVGSSSTTSTSIVLVAVRPWLVAWTPIW